MHIQLNIDLCPVSAPAKATKVACVRGKLPQPICQIYQKMLSAILFIAGFNLFWIPFFHVIQLLINTSIFNVFSKLFILEK